MALDLPLRHPVQFVSPMDALSKLAFQPQVQVLDVRIPGDLKDIPRALPRARLICPRQAADIPGPCLILCHKGQKLSIGAAALRSAQGLTSYVIEGGMCAWRDSGLPSMALWAATPEQLWVSPENTADQAIAWMAARVLSQSQTHLQVPAAHVSSVCEKFDGRALSDPKKDLDLDWPALFQMQRALPKFSALSACATPNQRWHLHDILLQAAHQGAAI